MKIIIDTREQRPLVFPYDNITDIVSEKLEVGDYWCEYSDGSRPPMQFERKSLADLYGTFSRDIPIKRFNAKLKRAEVFNIQPILIVECPLIKIAKGYKHSKMPPNTLIKGIYTRKYKYDIDVVYCYSREEMAFQIYHDFYGCEKSKKRWNGTQSRKPQSQDSIDS